MVKRKKTTASGNDTKVAAIILGIFATAVVLFLCFSKGKEKHPVHLPRKEVKVHKVIAVRREERPRTYSEPSDAYIPSESIKPVEPLPAPVPIEKVPGSGGKIAFIIDDWGNTTANCKYLRDIPEPLAVSILPGLRHTKDVASCAKLYHKLTMLHLPLEAFHNSDPYPQDYIIKTSMPPALASRIVDEDLSQLPSIEGVNNHMGSKATEDKALMRLVLKKLKSRGLFFVDSMTAPHTVCTLIADEIGLSSGKRDVFLDNVMNRQAIIVQIMEAARKARRRGYAVAIGHDRPMTMQVLKEEIPLLESQGFKIVSIKELLKNK